MTATMSQTTFDNCPAILARARSKDIDGTQHKAKLIARNTLLYKVDDDTYAIRFHQTDIVLIHRDGTFTLDSGGWRTLTTKERINEFTPTRLSQDKGIWYVTGHIVFEDGMRIDAEGKPIGDYEDAKVVEARKRKLDRMVTKYVKGFCARVAQHRNIEVSSGDCWCCMNAEGDMNDIKVSEPMGVSHLFSHFNESYYVPRMAQKAILVQGFGNPGFIWGMIQREAKDGETDQLQRVLVSYFRKLKPALLQYMKERDNEGGTYHD